jgi:hypothetical protein
MDKGRDFPGPFLFMVKRPTRTLLILTLCGLALAVWLILYGLQLRFFGQFLELPGVFSIFTPPTNLLSWMHRLQLGGDPADWGWPLVVFGCSLLGSLGALWKRQGWARTSLIVFSLASLITLHWMNSLSIVMLGLTRIPAIKDWSSIEDSQDG